MSIIFIAATSSALKEEETPKAMEKPPRKLPLQLRKRLENSYLDLYFKSQILFNNNTIEITTTIILYNLVPK